MEHEDKAFGGRQRVEHHEQRDADRVREQGFAFGIRAFSAHDSRFRDLSLNRLFAP